MSKNPRNYPPFLVFWRYAGPVRELAVALLLCCLVLFYFHSVWALLPGLLLLGLLAFFRSPFRRIPSGDCLLSPADGKIDDLAVLSECPEIGGPAVRIGIFLSVLDVHVVRSPLTGNVKSVLRIPGAFHMATSTHVRSTNQRHDIGLTDSTAQPFFLRLISGAIARRTLFEPVPGDAIRAGDIVGMIRCRSRTEVYIPQHAGYEIRAVLGQRVKGGETVLATTTSGAGNRGAKATPRNPEH